MTYLQQCSSKNVISIHALREEGDRDARIPPRRCQISIHALREEGDPKEKRQRCGFSISIHALREEGDSSSVPFLYLLTDFYPRPPRGGRR